MDQNLVPVLESVRAFLEREHGLWIDGKPRAALSGRRNEVRNPASGGVIASVADGEAADVDAAVASARRAFESGAWSGLRPAERERVLLRLADLLEAHAEELAQLETLNQGKSIHLARAIEVGGSIEYVRYMAGWATKITGETLDVSIPAPPGARFTAFTRREPVGVAAGIAPWNFPLMIALWKTVPALAAGCTAVLKPASETPLSALRLAELALEAGVPPGVFNVVTGRGEVAGRALAGHPLIGKVSFTGSTEVGKAVGHAALDNMTRLALELGGKNPMLVLGDADIDQAVKGALLGGFLNQGQVCAAASRLYVHRSKFNMFAEALSAAVAGMRLGPGMDLDAQVNPLVSQRRQQAVCRLIECGRAAGARVLTGGAAADLPGYFVQPTVMTDLAPDNPVAREEVFGPVLALIPFDEVDEAVTLANDTRYGLAASVWTNDLSAALDIVPRLQAGTVWVNSHIPLDPGMPFGGYKESGLGREFGKGAVESFTEIKSVCIAH